MSEFDILQQKILNYFPPVNLNISEVYEETTQSYETFMALIPLKHLINDAVYAPEIIKALQTLRILLRSNLDNNRFIYELNLLVTYWGKGGYYRKSILKQELVNLISKINIVHIHNELEKQKHEEELMIYAEQVSIDYTLDNLHSKFEKVTLSPNPKNKIRLSLIKKKFKKKIKRNIPPFNEFDLLNLSITD